MVSGSLGLRVLKQKALPPMKLKMFPQMTTYCYQSPLTVERDGKIRLPLIDMHVGATGVRSRWSITSDLDTLGGS